MSAERAELEPFDPLPDGHPYIENIAAMLHE